MSKLQLHTSSFSFSSFRLAGALLCALVLAACATGRDPAPIADRSPGAASRPSVAASAPGAAASAAAPAFIGPFADKAGQPGYYTVKRGDTLFRIALETGQDWRDIVKWNSLDNANVIEVNQVLRVRATPGAVVAAAPAPVRAASAPAGAASAPAGAASAPIAAPARVEEEDELALAWPAAGPVIQPFDESKNKGIDIGGKAGDPVYAAADGRVVYQGAAVRGLGNLLIIKHNNTYITAYAHNQTLLVKDQQVVKRGQKIAEMGSSDADRVKLHFEIRKNSVPVDPLKLLPSK
jgi:lipoprotein NlpD